MGRSSRMPRIATAGRGSTSGCSRSPVAAQLGSQRMTATKPNRRFPRWRFDRLCEARSRGNLRHQRARRASAAARAGGASANAAVLSGRQVGALLDRYAGLERNVRGRRACQRDVAGRRCHGRSAAHPGVRFRERAIGIWAPDSTHILFLGAKDASDPSKALDWYLTSRDGGTMIRTGALDALRNSGVTGAPVPSDWDATDNSVILASSGSGGSNLWKIKLGAADGRIAGRPDRLTFGTAIERSPVRSSSGGIAFASLVENVDVWRVAARSRYRQGRGTDGTHHQ